MLEKKQQHIAAVVVLLAVFLNTLALPVAAGEHAPKGDEASTAQYADSPATLATLLADASVEVVYLCADITLEGTLVVDRAVTIQSDTSRPGAPFTLYAPDLTAQKHHFSLAPGAQLTLRDLVLDGQNSGGGAFVPAGSTLAMRNVTARDLRNSGGEAGEYIFLVDGGTLAMVDSYITGSFASGCGAPVVGTNGAALTLNGGALRQNTSEGALANSVYACAGGVLLLQGASLVVEGTRFEDNQSGVRGGAISARDSGTTVQARNAVFASNRLNISVGVGGAIAVEEWATLFAEGCLFQGNAAGDGGAVGGMGGVITLDNCELYGNRAERKDGGAVYVRNENNVHAYGELTLQNGTRVGGYEAGQGNYTLNADATKYGAGVFFSGTKLSISDSFFVNNTTYGGGAGLYSEGQELYITNTLFEGNTALDGEGGGAALLCETLDGMVEGCTFRGNQTSAGDDATMFHFGGALLTAYAEIRVEDCVFEDNAYYQSPTAPVEGHYGGGALTNIGFGIEVAGTAFWNNYSDTDGGAIYVEEYDIITLEDVAFGGNFALNGAYGAADGDSLLAGAHETQVAGTKGLSYPFGPAGAGQYAFNNYDVNYMGIASEPLPRVTVLYYDDEAAGEPLLEEHAYTGIPYHLPAQTAGFDSDTQITGRVFLGWQMGEKTLQPGDEVRPGAGDLAFYALSRAGADEIVLEKVADTDSIRPGEDIGYTLRLVNEGDYPWRGSLTDTLPAELAGLRDVVVNGDATPAYTTAGNVLTLPDILLQGGETLIIRYTATVEDEVEAGDTIRNEAAIAGAGGLAMVSAMDEAQTEVLAPAVRPVPSVPTSSSGPDRDTSPAGPSSPAGGDGGASPEGNQRDSSPRASGGAPAASLPSVGTGSSTPAHLAGNTASPAGSSKRGSAGGVSARSSSGQTTSGGVADASTPQSTGTMPDAQSRNTGSAAGPGRGNDRQAVAATGDTNGGLFYPMLALCAGAGCTGLYLLARRRKR